jgi:MoxR-like ATPase
VAAFGNEELLFRLADAPATAGTAAFRPTAPAASAPEPAPAPRAPRPAALPALEGDLALVQEMKACTDAIREEVGKVIVGQAEVLDQILMVLLAGGHGLLVGMPGMAKTLMVSTIARVLDMGFKRIQFTPDLMPTDITGTEVLETNRTTNEKEFRFMQGPLFTNLLLADEINRTPPKTQAALLQSMAEYKVSASGKTYELDLPFMVFATQNPIEQEGTYPLPEAQLDRFMFFVKVDYPGRDEEIEIVKNTTGSGRPKLQKVLSPEEILALQELVLRVPVSDEVVRYAVDLARATRPAEGAPGFIREYLSWGAGPRASQYLVRAAKARAILQGRVHADREDIRALATPVLRHRLVTNFHAEAQKISTDELIRRLLETVK